MYFFFLDEISRTLCGSEESSVDTFSNMAKLKFKSLSSSRGSNLGFLASINASVEACGGTLEGTTGTIQTPGYPHGYAHRKFCAWSIIGPADRRIKLTFDDFDLEPPVVQLSTNRSRCRYDYVYITSGNLRQFRHVHVLKYQFY